MAELPRTAEFYRQRAHEARDMAAVTANMSNREMLLQIAKSYDVLAVQVDEQDKRGI